MNLTSIYIERGELRIWRRIVKVNPWVLLSFPTPLHGTSWMEGKRGEKLKEKDEDGREVVVAILY